MIFSLLLPFQLLTSNFAVAKDSPIAPDTSKFRTINPTEDIAGQTIELENQRSEYSKTYMKPDGTKEKMISATPINYLSTENNLTSWKDIDTNLTEKPVGQDGLKEYQNKANSFALTFSEDLANKGIKLSKDDSAVNLKINSLNASEPPTSSPVLFGLNKVAQINKVKPTLNENDLQYKGLAKDIDVNYQSTAEGFKDEIVLNKYNGKNVFSFQLNLTNLYFEKLSTGAFIFYNSKTKKPMFYMPQSFMNDSNKSADYPEGALSYNIKTEIIPNLSGFEIRLTADKNWLADSKRVFPIIIDPSFEVGLNYGEDSYVQQYYPNTNSWDQKALYIGRTNAKGVTRTFIPFSIDNISKARINSARVSAYQYTCQEACQNFGVRAKLTGDYNPQTITWNNYPTVYQDEMGYTTDSGINKWVDIDVTRAAKYWFEAGNPDGTKIGSFEFSQDNESNNGQRNWKAENANPGYSPKLYINYNDYNSFIGVSQPSQPKVDQLWKNITAGIENTGRNTWQAGKVKLSYHIYDQSGNQVVWDGERTDLPHDIAPGGYIEFNANLKIPSSPGVYTIKWDLVEEYVTWFSNQGIPTFDYSINVSDYPAYDAQYQPVNIPTTAAANTTINIPINIHNGSKQVWTTDNFKVSYHWIDNDNNTVVIQDGIQTTLPRNVASRDDKVTVNMQVKAPFNAGNYKLKIDMYQNGVGYFSNQGVTTGDYNFTITPPSFSALTRLGTEDYYAMAGPVDLATGNLAYSSTDMAISSNTGLLSMERSYNATSLDETYNHDANGFIQKWLINGAYRENDQAVRLNKTYISNETTIAPNTNAFSNGKVWVQTNTDGQYLDISKALDQNGIVQNGYGVNSVAYANTYVYSPTAQQVKLKLGSDDGIKVWLNNNLVLNKDVYRGLIIDSDVVNVNLNSGWNRLLVKVSQGDGSWSFSARFTTSADKPVVGLKYSYDNQALFGDYQLLGKGWTTNFNETIYGADENNVYYRDATGSINLFTKKTDGSYTRPTGANSDLIKNSDATFTITSKSGLKINFNNLGKLVSKIDLSGNTLLYQYDSKGNCTKILDGSRVINLTYSGQQLVSITNGLGNKYTYTFDNTTSPAKLTKVTDPSGTYYTYAYDANGKLASFTDKNSKKTQISYDSNKKVSEIKNALNNSTKFNYLNGKTEITDPLGRKSTAEFDKNNLLTAFTDAKNYREFYQYDGNYNVISVTPDIPENDGYFYRYSYAYDTNANLVSETDPMDKKTTYNYSGNDLTKITDPDGSVNSYAYSADGRRLLLSEQNAQGNASTYTYDAKGRRITTADALSNIIQSSYSADGDVLSTTSPKKETVSFTYDAIGRKLTDKTALGKKTTYTYSPLSYITKITDPAGLYITFIYDKNGNKTKEINPNNASKNYQYDALNQLTKSIDEVGASISYEYDAVGNKVKTIDANGKITAYQYDELNRQIGETTPVGGNSTVAYDRNNQPTKITDPNNQTTTQQFDKTGNVNKVIDPEGTTNYSYSQDGKLTNASSTVGSENVSLAYDKNDNLTNLNSNVAGNVAVSYNKNDSPTNIQTPTTNINLSYDPNGQVQTVNSSVGNQNLTTNITRDAEGKITNATKSNGDTASYIYDASNRTTSITNSNKSKVVLSKFSYLYDKASNIKTVKEDITKITNNYIYDARNQLTKENNTIFSYDPMGNRQKSTNGTNIVSYQYDTKDTNRLIKVTYPDKHTITFEYDANGNITKRIDSQLGTTSYIYDSDDYFTKAILPDNSSVEYTYDKILKLRIKRVEKNSTGTVVNTTKFIFDGDRLVSETDDSGKILRSYAWDENERLFSVSIPDSTGALQTFNYVKNLKEDIVGMTDIDGNLVATYQYDAWGNIIKSATLATSKIPNIDKINPRLYSSYWRDSTLGLYFMKTRMYDSNLGRFLSKDPLISGNTALSYNPYIYCGNNPVDNIDPSGKGFWSAVSQYASKAVQAVKNLSNSIWNWTGDSTLKKATVVLGAGILAAGVGFLMGVAVAALAPLVLSASIALSACVGAASTLATKGSQLISGISKTYSVYMSKTGDYVGMTKNFADRAAYWASKGRDISEVPGLRNLSYEDARAFEQALIEKFGGPNGPILVNKINSIAEGSVRYLQLVPNAVSKITAIFN